MSFPRQGGQRAPRAPLAIVCLLLAATGPRLAAAIHADSGVDAGECQWAGVVHFGSTCTGTYLGDGLVVSAAHCDSPGSVKFGEFGRGGDGGLGWFSVKVLRDGASKKACKRHPSYDTAKDQGVDVMWCKLDPDDENYGKLANVPIVSPMIPTGCARDWLSNQVYNVHRCPGAGSTKFSCGDKGPEVFGVGVGCANAAVSGSTGCSMDDRKRYLLPGGRLVRQQNKHGDPTSLLVKDDLVGSGVMSGDSGGPLYIELPDGTWRQIGVLHSSGIGASYSALPPRLRWIEASSGRDITPCHQWSGGRYRYQGGCGGRYPLNPEAPPAAARWKASRGCSAGMPFAQLSLGECGTWGLGAGGKLGFKAAVEPNRRRRDLGVRSGLAVASFALGSKTTNLFENHGFKWQRSQCQVAKRAALGTRRAVKLTSRDGEDPCLGLGNSRRQAIPCTLAERRQKCNGGVRSSLRRNPRN